MSGVSDSGAYKALKWQVLHGSLARRVIIRAFLFVIAVSSLPLMLLVCDTETTTLYPVNSDECATHLGLLDPNSILGRVLKPFIPIACPHMRYAQCKESDNLIIAVVRELIGKHLLNHDAKSLCVGWGSASAEMALRKLGFANVYGVYRHPFFTLKQKQVVYEFDYEDNSFDFILTRDLDKVSVPALLIDEVERILKPGGLGAMVVSIKSSSPSSLIRSATPVSSFLKSSSVMHVTSLIGFTLVAFRKKFDTIASFKQYQLPADCGSIMRNKPFMGHLEPLVKEKLMQRDRGIAYLPNFTHVSPKRRLVYIDMGAREAANFSNSNWFLPSYPLDSRAFDAYIVDHNALVLTSHVNKPGVTFIYHPGLAGNFVKPESATVQDIELPFDDEEFDFLRWFNETVETADFVVLKMNMGKAELKLLFELFETRAICSVDELFIQCSNSDSETGGRVYKENCMELCKGLRSSGVYVHQWWGS
ncbi:hypothetical protein Nepgr_011919 [Nepenthes gracilis]|uniref:Methyltransferase type 11 domain-containing protein n=1 Tax=Nepenthes gracilis TaxID=150966 RepID=A0AAD3XMC7_NEPGR|nr:hypothetical protein Nepgr_011919 [Nepenthes gracilis]